MGSLPTAANLIDGHWTEPAELAAVTDPSDGTTVGRVGVSDAATATAAVDAAAAAFGPWAALPARARANLLEHAAQSIAGAAERLGHLLAREAGKRLPEAVGEVQLSAEYFRWFAEEARRPAGAVHPHEDSERRHLTLHRPCGVVACLTPWNFPCSIQARKLAAALAAGCTVVARVSEKAPLAVTEMIHLVNDVGLPSGVLNLVHGSAAKITDAYLSHPAVRVVSFTGSTEVGSSVMAKAANRIVRPLLELGGNAPYLVFGDADVERAADAAMLAKFRNTGQSCIAANRFIVHASVHDQFVAALTARIDAMTIGPGCADPVPDLGPCISATRVDAVAGLVQDAVDRGGRIVTDPPETPRLGAFHQPALVVGAPVDVALATSEVFGPAAAVFPFDSDEEALQLANATEMGLAAYAFTRSADRMWLLGEQLQAGIIGFNHPLPTTVFAPMGGTKQSGLGREGSDLGLAEFCDVHYIAVGL